MADSAVSFADLHLEHQAFLCFLDGFETAGGIPEPEPLRAFAALLEGIHHKKEEDLLLPLLMGSEAVNVGGPKCMTFFTPRVLGGAGWVDSFHGLRDFLGLEGAEQMEPLSPFRQRAWEANSSLRIPLEDHILGAKAMAALRSGDSRPGLDRARLFAKFSALLRDHIRREDECLFQVYGKALTAEQRRWYVEEARAFDACAGTAGLLRELAAYGRART